MKQVNVTINSNSNNMGMKLKIRLTVQVKTLLVTKINHTLALSLWKLHKAIYNYQTMACLLIMTITTQHNNSPKTQMTV